MTPKHETKRAKVLPHLGAWAFHESTEWKLLSSLENASGSVVWQAEKTPGGLTKEDLKINAKGRVRHAISEDRLRNRCLEQRFRYEALTCSAKKGICTVSTLSVYTVPVAALAACWFCLLPLTVCLPCWLLSGFCCSNLPLTCSYVDLLAVYFY